MQITPVGLPGFRVGEASAFSEADDAPGVSLALAVPWMMSAGNSLWAPCIPLC